MSQEKDTAACRIKWFAYNQRGRGNEKHSIGKARYDGPIFYHDDVPCQRLVQNKAGDWVLLHKYFGTKPPEGAITVTAVAVPDLAVFSKYSGDWYDDPEDIHARTKYIMLMRVNALLEEVEAASANQFEATATGGISYQVKNWEGKLEKFYREWRKYGDAMLLDWGDLPDLYRNKFNNIVEAKQRAWNDPYAVERRERARARKAAKKALGVE